MASSSEGAERALAPPGTEGPEARRNESRAGDRTHPRGVAALLLETGALPAFKPGDGGTALDPSPLAGLPRKDRVRRLVGLLELFASYGDAGAAAEALRHHRWAEEMRKGRPATRGALDVGVAVTVVNSLATGEGGTPIPPARRRLPVEGNEPGA